MKLFLNKIIILILTCLFVGVAEGEEFILSNIKTFGHYEGFGEKGTTYYIDNNYVRVGKGESLRYEFNRFDEEGVNTDIIDIEGTLINKSDKFYYNIQIDIEIIPKVSRIVYEKKPPDLIDEKRTVKSAKWKNKVFAKSVNIIILKPHSSEKILFEGFNLRKVIDNYFKRELWPVEIKIKLDIKYKGTESSKKIYPIQKKLVIPFPPY